MVNDPRHPYQVGNPHPSQDTVPDSGIPEWAYTIHPREIAFYSHKLEELNRIHQGIAAIARILSDSRVHEETVSPLDWMNNHSRHGLHLAIEELTEKAAGTVEFMIERADKYRTPKN